MYPVIKDVEDVAETIDTKSVELRPTGATRTKSMQLTLTETTGIKAEKLIPSDTEEYALFKPDIKPIDRHRSCDVSALYDLPMAIAYPRHSLWNLEQLRITEHIEYAQSPAWKSGMITPKASNSSQVQAEAWEALRRSLVYFRGRPVGTIAALDPSEESLNYNQVSFL